MMARNDLLPRTLVQLADSLVDDFDVVELLTLLADRCVDVLGVTAAGLMLAAPEGDLRVMAASSEAARLLELFELQAQEGPCFECYRTGVVQLNGDLAAAGDRWPQFAPYALGAADVLAAQALGDVATIAILQHRAMLEAQVLNEQLQHALNARVVIEQAKGVLAERMGDSMEQAFDRMRTFARRNNFRLADVAQRVIDGELATRAFLTPPGPDPAG